MRGTTKKSFSKLKRRVLASATAMLMAFNTIGGSVIPVMAAPSETAVYDGGYDIASILSRYQFFVKDNVTLNSSGHTVGAIAVGGICDIDNGFADIAIVPSYVNHWEKGMTWQNGFQSADAGYSNFVSLVKDESIKSAGTLDKTIYYGTRSDAVVAANYTSNNIHNPGYMNIPSAFTQIEAESVSLAGQATKEVHADGAEGNKSITIDCTTGSDYINVKIPYADYAATNVINVNVSEVDWFKENVCVISIVDIPNESSDPGASVSIDFDGYSKIRIGGVAASTALEAMSDGCYGSMQANYGGMNLVWNFPGFTGSIDYNNAAGQDLKTQGIAGHLVAPGARVNLNNGNYEGGIICRELTGGAQGHFYPMSKTFSSSSVVTTDGIFSKVNAADSKEVPGATITLTYTAGSSNLNGVTKKAGPDINKKSATEIEWVSTTTPLELSKLPAGKYTMKETGAPAGYAYASDITFEVKDDGKIYDNKDQEITDKKLVMKDEAIKGTFRKTDVAKTAEVPDATITLTYKSGDKDLKDVECTSGHTISKENGNKVIKWVSTTTPLELSKLPIGTYVMSETNAPANYAYASDITFIVKEDGKFYKTDNTSIDGNKLEMVDEKLVLADGTFSKAKVVGGPEIEGATIVLTYEGKSDLSGVIKTSGPAITLDTTTNKKITWTSGTAPVALSGLPAGDYTMEETGAPSGYAYASKIQFVVKNDGKLYDKEGNAIGGNKLTMIDKAISATFSKTDVATPPSEIKGAELELIYEEGNYDLSKVTKDPSASGSPDFVLDETTKKKITWTSNGTAPLVLTMLPIGKYTLKETGAPDGYAYASDIFFEVKNDGTFCDADGKAISNKIVMQDKALATAEVTFSKYDVANSIEINGATIKLTYQDGKYDLKGVTCTSGHTSVTKAADNKSITWISNGTPVVLSGLPEGTYDMEETNAPATYAYAETITFKVKDDGTLCDAKGNKISNKIVMEDKKLATADNVTFSKTDVTEKAEVSGATITLTYTGKYDLSTVTKADASGPDFTLDTTTNKKITWTSGTKPLVLSGLLAGTYVMKETNAPNGYAYASDITFTVGDDGKLYDKDNKQITDKKLKMVDEAIGVTFSKTDVTGAEVPGATITLTADVDLSKVTVTSGEGSPTITLDKTTNKKITWTSTNTPLKLSELPVGTYTMHEEGAPAGYAYASDITFVVKNDGKIYASSTATSPINETNKIEMVDEAIGGTFSKVDAANGPEIPGATLTLTYTGTGNLSGVTKVSGPNISKDSANKVITWTSTSDKLVLTKLPIGTYTMHEENAPDGYAYASDITFVIKDDGKMYASSTDTTPINSANKIEMIDKAITTTRGIFSKVAVADGPEIPGATIELEANVDISKVTKVSATDSPNFTVDATNPKKITWTSTGKALELADLPAGTYTMTETGAPAGYTYASAIKFVIKDDGKFYASEEAATPINNTNKIQMIDKAIGATFHKVDVANGPEIPGATLKLTANVSLSGVEKVGTTGPAITYTGGTTNTITWTSTTEALELSKLPAGTYTMTETGAPTGYTRYTSTITFVVKDDGKVYQADGTTPVGDNKIEMVDDAIIGTFSKEDVTGSEIPGAKLTLTYTGSADLSGVVKTPNTSGPNFKLDETTKKTITWTSTDEPLKLSKLPVGTYTMEETGAPAGYAYADKITFEIKDDGKMYQPGTTTLIDATNKIEMTDDAIGGTFSKVAITGGSEIPGAKLTLTYTGAENLSGVTRVSGPEISKDSTNKVITWTSGSAELVLSKLPIGSYTMHEESRPDATYAYASDITFVIKKDGKMYASEESTSAINATNTIEMVDEKLVTATATFSKTKVSTTGELPGATITLKYSGRYDLNDVNRVSGPAITGRSETSITWVSTTEEMVLSKLPGGTYTMEETGAPAGYAYATDIVFVVKNDGKLYQKDGVTIFDTSNRVEMKDEALNPATATFKKVDVTGGDEIPGAKLKLTYTGKHNLANVTKVAGTTGPDFTLSEDKKEITWTSIEKQSLQLTGIPEGTYTMEETGVPNGYAYASEITFIVKNDGKLYQEDGKTLIDANNKVEMLDEVITATFSKKNATKTAEVPGATIKLSSDNADLSGVKKATTAGPDITAQDEHSITWISGTAPMVLTMLPIGSYTMEETGAPNGYAYASAITFVIKKDGKAYTSDTDTEIAGNTIEMVDTAIEVTFSKTDVTKTAEVPGAKIKLSYTGTGTLNNVERESGPAITTKDATSITWTSDTAPMVLTKLPIGSYKMEETGAPDGYTYATEINFVIKKDGKIYASETADTPINATNRIEMVDTAIDVTFSKVAVANGPEISGATIKLSYTGKATLNGVDRKSGPAIATKTATSITWVSTTEAMVLTKLPAGSYKMEETGAPAGYTYATKIEFVIKEDGKIYASETDTTPINATNRIEMVDTAIDGTFSKTTVTGAELPGATITLSYSGTANLAGVDRKSGPAIAERNNTIIKWTSTSEPMVLTKLPVGKYTMHEVNAPSGYAYASDIKFEVKEDGNFYKEDGTTIVTGNKIVMVDEASTETPPPAPTTGKLIITKTIKGDVTDEEVKGALKFKVTAPDGTSVTYTLAEFNYDSTTKKYTKELQGLAAGSYTVEETDYTLDGRTCTVTYSVGGAAQTAGALASASVTAGGTATVDFENDYKKTTTDTPPEGPTGKLIITKTIKGDVTKDEIEGALEFKVTAPDGSSTTYTLEDFTYNPNTKIYTLELDGLETGSYIVEETDYDIDGNTCTVTYSVNAAGATAGTTATTTVAAGATTTVAFENTYKNVIVDVSLLKTYEGAELASMNAAKRSKLLANTKFTLYEDDECTTVAAGTKEQALTWDAANSRAIVTFQNLKAEDGTTFYMKETSAPDGYSSSITVFEAVVSRQDDGTYKVQYYDEATDSYKDEFPTCVNKKGVEIGNTIQKVSSADSSVCLKGAEFTLYEYSVKTGEVGEKIATATSDKKGYVADFGYVAAGEYLLVETKAPEGYQKTKVKYIVYVSIDKNNKGKVEFAKQDSPKNKMSSIVVANTPISSDVEQIKLIKTYQDVTFADMNQNQIKKLLAATKFTLYRYDADRDKKVKLVSVSPELVDGKAQVSFDNSDKKIIEPGNMYYFEETKAPDGYVVSEEGYYAKVSKDGKVTYSTTGPDGKFTSKAPTCENVKDNDTDGPNGGGSGVLVITKTIKGDVTKEEYEGALVFKVTKPNKTSKKYTLKDFKYNSSTKKYTLELPKLKEGKYTVEETAYDVDGKICTVSYQVDGGEKEDGTKVTVSVGEDDKTTVAYENKYKDDSEEDKEGELLITKTIKGSVTREEAEGALQFVVTRVSDGKKRTYTLKDFEYNEKKKRYELTLKKVPGSYTVQETVYDVEGHKLHSLTYVVDEGDEQDGRDVPVKVTVENMGFVAVHYTDEYRRTDTSGNEDNDNGNNGGGNNGGGNNNTTNTDTPGTGGDTGTSSTTDNGNGTTTTTTTDNRVPRTGDSTSLAGLLALALIGLSGCVGIVFYKKKRRN